VKRVRTAYLKAWRASHKERCAALEKVWYIANKERRAVAQRAHDMAARPERFRKAYDPNCRPFPATLDLETGEWVRCEPTLLRAPDTSLAARVAAAIIVIEERRAA
jgi:hypothetical protein